MTNRIKGSFPAKFFAWVGVTLSAVVLTCGILGVVAMVEMDVYDRTAKEIWEDVAKGVSEDYAVMALAGMQHPADDKFLDSSFRYGIIEGDDWASKDLNSDSTYIERNFSERVTADDLYWISHEVGEDTYFEYQPSRGIFGSYYLYENWNSYVYSKQVYNICYVEEEGIFYYETSDDKFPVLWVTLEIPSLEDEAIRYRFACVYDFDANMYAVTDYIGAFYCTEASDGIEMSEATEDVGSTEETDDESTDVLPETADGLDEENGSWLTINAVPEEMHEEVEWGQEPLVLSDAAMALLDQEYITFDMFEAAGVRANVLLEEAYLMGEEVLRVEPGWLEGDELTTERDYGMENGRILTIRYSGSAETKPYTVVCLLPEPELESGALFAKTAAGDMYAQAWLLISGAYGLRYSIYGILIAALVLTVGCLIFLITAAGRRRGTTEIRETFLDRMPLEIYLAFAFFIEMMLLAFVLQISYSLEILPIFLLFCLGILCMFWLGLAVVLGLAVRIKCGRLWKNTLTYRLLALMGRGFKKLVRGMKGLVESLPLLWKVIGLLTVIFVAEFTIMIIIYNRAEVGILFWILEKLALMFLVCWYVRQMWILQKGGERIAQGDLSQQVDTGKLYGAFKQHGEQLNSISNGISRAVDERMKSEHFKTELITNVSHDIKTPLTSIINYVDLLEKEDLQNEKAAEYLEVLDRQSNRLKKLIEDLMEASKASTGNLTVNLERLEAGVFLVQTVGEYEERTRGLDLELLIRRPEEPAYILADGRHFWRVIDNLMNNICKYAQPGTRVYINMEQREGRTYLIFRNTSRYPLNITGEELMERFVRGDASRNTEGNGLGLSIARSLMELMKGSFELYVDGDLFKVVIGFDTLI